MAKITFQQLKNLNACPEAQMRFTELFGWEADVTEENVERWQEAYGDSFWHMAELLSKEGKKQWWLYKEQLRAANEHDGYPANCCPACRKGRAKFVELYNKENDHA